MTRDLKQSLPKSLPPAAKGNRLRATTPDEGPVRRPKWPAFPLRPRSRLVLWTRRQFRFVRIRNRPAGRRPVLRRLRRQPLERGIRRTRLGLSQRGPRSCESPYQWRRAKPRPASSPRHWRRPQRQWASLAAETTARMTRRRRTIARTTSTTNGGSAENRARLSRHGSLTPAQSARKSSTVALVLWSTITHHTGMAESELLG